MNSSNLLFKQKCVRSCGSFYSIIVVCRNSGNTKQTKKRSNEMISHNFSSKQNVSYLFTKIKKEQNLIFYLVFFFGNYILFGNIFVCLHFHFNEQYLPHPCICVRLNYIICPLHICKIFYYSSMIAIRKKFLV